MQVVFEQNNSWKGNKQDHSEKNTSTNKEQQKR